MRQIAFKIMLFMLVFNLAVGLLTFISNGGTFTKIEGTWTTQSLEYDENLGQKDLQDLQDTLGNAPVENSNNFGEKILDFFSLGLYSKVKGLVNNLLFGIVNIFVNIGLVNNELAGVLNTFLGFIYIAGMYELFTGKSILG